MSVCIYIHIYILVIIKIRHVRAASRAEDGVGQP